MALRQITALAWRESRTARRRLLLYMSSIAFGVAALVAIDSFSQNVTRSVHEQSLSLTGGDVSLSSRRPFNESAKALMDSLDRAGVAIERMTTFPSMAFVPRSGATRLVQIRAVTPGYPHYGEITSRPPAAWHSLHTGRDAVVDQSLLLSLGAEIGDTVAIGESAFEITGTLAKVPGELGISATIGPRIYIAEAELAATGLLVFGSRAEYDAVVKLPEGMRSAEFFRRFDRRFDRDSVRVRSAGRNEARLANSIDQLRDFLAIVALVALLLGGVGVASGVHAFVLAKIDSVAILRCLGATGGQVLFIYVTQAAAMGLVGALAGAAMGLGAQFALPNLVQDFVPVDIGVRLEPLPIALGVGTGVWVALMFALRPLLSLRLVSPLQALRRDTDENVLRRASHDSLSIVVGVAIVASVLGLALLRSDTLMRGLMYTAAIAGAIGALFVAAALLTRLARRLSARGLPFPVRQGIAALHRPGNQTRAVVIALGFGVFLIGTVYQVQRNLLRTLETQLGESRGNVVLFDVQEDQRDSIEAIVRASGQQIVSLTPIVRMRIDSINGRSVGSTEGRRDATDQYRSGWAVRREYNSTFRDSLADSERLTQGEWFGASRTRGLPEISVETDLAGELRLTLGDTITWNVQGVRVATVVTSFREVKWATFQPNFFIVFEPRALLDAPRQYVILATAPTPAEVGAVQRGVVSAFPAVSSVDLSLVQETVGKVLGRVTMAVRFLAILSVALAVPVLFSAVATTRRQRLREGVLLKTLGATQRQIAQVMLSEYSLLGILGAAAGTVLSVAASWALTYFVFKLSYAPAMLPLVGIATAMTLLAVAIGTLTGREVFKETPMAALREA